MDRISDKRQKFIQRKKRVRKKITGTGTRPRLSIYKSHRNISVQIIDDTTGRTLVSVSTLEKEFGDVKHNVEGGKFVGQKIGERLLAADIRAVVFDRSGYMYHGIVKAVADGAREAGLKF